MIDEECVPGPTGPLAQSVERGAYNAKVRGSSPLWTILNKETYSKQLNSLLSSWSQVRVLPGQLRPVAQW